VSSTAIFRQLAKAKNHVKYMKSFNPQVGGSAYAAVPLYTHFSVPY
jgi:hypothetical protein